MLITKSYDRSRAVEYARRWALGRNPLFLNFTGIGGDCTNFASQSVYAGSCDMNYLMTFGWYYISASDRAPAWTGVEYFYNFMTGNSGVGPFAREVGLGRVLPGDVIQLGNDEGFCHGLVVTELAPGAPLVAAHSDDSLDRPLDSYIFQKMRCLHIEGVRQEAAEYDIQPPNCFNNLINGKSLM